MPSHILFGSAEWHLWHNLQLSKRHARIAIDEYRRTGLGWWLQYAIECTCRALNLKKRIRGFQ
jgi:hypothetical protein